MKKYQITLAITALILFACSPGESKTSAPPTVTPAKQLLERTVLTFDQLMNSFNPGSPVDDGAFAMPEDAKPAEHIFEGRLELIGEDSVGDILVL
ncbi:MAG: hypothetical protein IMY85_05550, partial [Chloroflexi bacterium]|nr:hypothetical protein [Chloroflexota bacterium]